MKQTILLCFIVLVVSGCATSANKTPIDQVPMYGSMDRSKFAKLKAADEKLIRETSAHYGSPEKASNAFVNNGFVYYDNDDLENAMRRFNQAWLLDKRNPQVYWGFGVVLHDKGLNCDAMEMMLKALSLNPPKDQGFYPDAGRVITLCAAQNESISDAQKVELFNKSEELFIKAESFEPKKGYLYSIWATAYYWRSSYDKAWEMVNKAEKNGGQLSKRFLDLLESRQARPN